jgi:hypothetical protein
MGHIRKIWRAGFDAGGKYWTWNREVAEAYMHNPPFGGPELAVAEYDERRCWDIRGKEARIVKRLLLNPLKYETDIWALEDPAIIAEMRRQGCTAIRYEDDYPDGADVLFIPDGMEGDFVEEDWSSW